MSVLPGKMDWLYYERLEADERVECEVRIADGEIVVSYDDGDGFVLYRGREHGQGHYVLECADRHAKATLHQLPGSRVLEGYWLEDGQRGMWRILLPEPAGKS